MRVKVPFAVAGGQREDIYNHQQAIAFWLLLNLLDYGLTVVALQLGAHELNPWVKSLSMPAFLLYKIALTVAAIAWLAFWKRLRFLKWLNLAFLVLVVWNIYDLIKLL